MEVGKRHEIFSSIFGGDSGESEDEGDRANSPVNDVEEVQEAADEEFVEEEDRAESPSSVTGAKESELPHEEEEEEKDEEKEEIQEKFDEYAAEPPEDAPVPDPASLFGESDDEEDLRPNQREDAHEKEQIEDDDEERGLGEGEDEEMDEYERQKKQRPIGPPLDLKIPLLPPIAPSEKMIVVAASNILGFEMRPFDPKTYEAGENMNVIRWRRVERDDGSMGLESNARFVRWSDGSVQLLLGNELLAADRQSMRQDKSHLFVRHPKLGVVQGQGRLLEKMKFRPVDLTSRIHKKLTHDLDSKYRKTTKVKNFVTVVDPEKEKEEREKAAEARIRSQEELARKQEKVMKKYDRPARTSYEPRRRAGYLEEDEEGEAWNRGRYMDEDEEAEAERRILHAKRAEPVYRKAKPKERAPVEKSQRRSRHDSEMDDFIVSEDEYEEEGEAEEEEEVERAEESRKRKKGRQVDDEELLEDEREEEEEEEELEDRDIEKQSKGRGKMEKRRRAERDEDEQEDEMEEEDGGEDGWNSDDRENERGKEVEVKKALQKKRRVVEDSDSD